MGAITNLYAYAADNPVNFSDATGTDIDLSNLTYNIPLGQTPIFKFYFNPLLDPFAQQPADLSSQIADAASNPILTPNLNFTPQDPKYQGPKFFPDYPSFTPNSDPSAPLTWSQLHDLVPPQFPNPTLPPLPPIAAPLYPGEPGPASNSNGLITGTNNIGTIAVIRPGMMLKASM